MRLRALRRAVRLATACLGLFYCRSSYATADRFGHSATLLPDGSIVFIGGQRLGVGSLNTIDVMSPSNSAITAPSGANSTLDIARSSHTATLLPNGKVLIAGGYDGTNIRGDAEVYDPVTQSIVTHLSLITGMTPRTDHSATLLRNGKVLLCGGFTTGGVASNTCDLFDPTQGAFGQFTAAAVSLTAARADHTATLLTDGRVFLAGGLSAPGAYLPTTELYTPGQAATSGGHALITARAYHQATLLSNGRLLINGGFNGNNIQVYSGSYYLNYGFLDSVEIYDPASDLITPAAQMLERTAFGPAILTPDGQVHQFGGLGNFTPNGLTATSLPITNGTQFTGSFSQMSTTTITGGSGSVALTMQVTPQVSGVISTGTVYLTQPTISIGNNGVVTLTSSDPILAASGTQASLQGVPITCTNTTTCGQINATLSLSTFTGTIYTPPVAVTVPAGTLAPGGGSQVCFSGGQLNDISTSLSLSAGSSFVNNNAVAITFPADFNGASISSGYIVLSSGTIVQTSSFTVTITHAYAQIPANTPIDSSGHATITPTWSQIQGTIQWTGTDPAQTFGSNPGPSCINVPVAGATPPTVSFAQLSGTMYYTVSQVTLTGKTLTLNSNAPPYPPNGTVVVQKMASSDLECYQPSNNTWSFGCGNRGVVQSAFMETGTLRPNGDQMYYGGASFSTTGSTVMATNSYNYYDMYITPNPGWAATPSMSSPRGNFTATPLPNGKILLAGGANGPSSQVPMADLFDPNSGQITATSSMTVARDLHTATLLDNGRVLVAGGFSANQATNLAEIYYPDTGVWLQTAPMISTRDSHVGLLLPDGTVLVAGGYANGQYLKSAEIYISTAGAWQTVGNMNVPRALSAASLLPNGKVLIAGGFNGSGALNSTEIFDPTARTFSAGPAMATARYSHSATMLPHGDVLIAGGDAGSGEISLCERYHYQTNSFIAASSMTVARLGHTATLLPNGIVAIVGGSTALSGTIKAVEVYHESDDFWLTSAGLTTSRGLHSTVVGQNGTIYAFGGYDGANYLSSGESIYFEGNIDGGNSSVRQSSITSLSPAAFDRSNAVVMAGKNFLGQTEAAGGGADAGNSSHFQPRLELQAVDGSNGTSSQGNGGFLLDLSTYIYANAANSGNWSGVNTSLTIQLPASQAALPYGWYHLREFNNAVYSGSLLVHAGPVLPANPPTNAAGTANSTSQITWTWTIPAGTFDGFNIYSATSGVFITTIAVQGAAGTNETWVQTGLSPDTTGQIKIAAYNLSGDGPSLTSPIVYSQVAAPTGLAVSSVTPSSVGLAWNVNGNNAGAIYEISMSTLSPPLDFAGGDLSVSTPVPTLLGLTTNNYIIANLQPSTTYDFRVRAFDGFGNASAFSNIVTTQTLAPVGNVIGLRQGPTSIQWSWINPCIGQSVCSFNIYNATSGVLIANVGSSLFVETKLATNTVNAIQVQAVTSAGSGPLSPATTVFTDAVVPAAIPSPITGLSTGSFTVGWAANGNPLNTKYNVVVMALGPGASFVSTTTTTNFSQSIGSLGPPAGTYDVQLLAVNGDGFATNVDSPTAVLDYGAVNLLANAPNSLSAPSVTPTSILLNWSTNNNSSSATYQVNYSTDNFVDVQTPLPFSAHASTGGFLITGLLSSSTYSFVVQAQNLVGVKTASSTVLTVQTSNGGAPPGQLGGTALANYDTTIAGTLGNGQQVSMFVPASSFPSNTQVVISSYSVGASPACPNVPAGAGMGIAITDSPAFQPQKPITVTLSYAPSQLGVPAAQAALMRLDPSGVCVPLQTVLDTAHLTLTAQLNHFSIYELGGLVPSSNVDSALIFPNPFYPGRGNGYVTFDHLPAGAWVRVFTLRGELVYATNTNGSGLITWPGTNQAGRPLASGVYLVSIELGSDKRVYKLAVER